MLRTRYRISDIESGEIRSLPVLGELPYFFSHHRARLSAIGDVVAVVSNRRHLNPSYVHLNTFHRHHSQYAAIDALAPPLAEFFLKTGILPIVDPIFERFRNNLEEVAPRLHTLFASRGILIPETARHEK